MPELPEVETVAQGLKMRALGRRIVGVEVRHPGVIIGAPEDFVSRLTGSKIVAVHRKGKVLILDLDGEAEGNRHCLMMRLGMTGQVTVQLAQTPLESHTHVVISFDDGREELRFRDARRFGNLRSLTREGMNKVLAALGPDAREMAEEEFFKAIDGRRGAIKS